MIHARQPQLIYRLVLGIAALGFGVVLAMVHPQVAIASVHTYSEPTGSVLFRSLQTLRDDRDRAWQAVLYKQFRNQQYDFLHLRLVGFPGAVEFHHPAHLQINWEAEPPIVLVDVTPPNLSPNAAEFDIQPAMQKLSSSMPLRLELTSEQETVTSVLQLVIPPFVVQEWLQVTNWQP